MSNEQLSAERLAELRQVAEAATQGEWKSDNGAAPWSRGDMYAEQGASIYIGKDVNVAVQDIVIGGCQDEQGGGVGVVRNEDAAHIAAFSPPTAIALLSALAAERETVARLETWRGLWKRYAKKLWQRVIDDNESWMRQDAATYEAFERAVIQRDAAERERAALKAQVERWAEAKRKAEASEIGSSAETDAILSLIDAETALLAALSPVEAGRETCKWTPNDDEEITLWNTSCGHKWSVESNDSPKKHGVNFCFHCGKPIEAVPYVDEDEGRETEVSE